MSSFQGVGVEEFTVHSGVLISGGWNRGVPLYTHFRCWNRGVLLYTEVSSFQGVGIIERVLILLGRYIHCAQFLETILKGV